MYGCSVVIAVIAFLGGVRASIFAGLALLLLVGYGVQTARIDRMQDKARAEQLREAKAATSTLESLRRIDAANQATQAANAKRFQNERATIEADAAKWRDAWAAGRVQVAPRFSCPARPAGNTGAPQDPGTYGLTTEDAVFLDRFASERDIIASERNEAVTGWVECRRISATPIK